MDVLIFSLNVTLLLIHFFVFAFFTSKLAKFFYWTIGEPEQNNYIGGRIFSFYGRFLVMKYKEYEKRELKRVETKYKEYLLNFNDPQNKEEEILNELKKNTYKLELERNKSITILKPLGLCINCFCIWLAIPIYLSLVYYFSTFTNKGMYLILFLPFFCSLVFDFTKGKNTNNPNF